ncbi:Farnesyl diphosphate synthase [Novipirellula aureliae]|uniref:Farnesyl diphosphate synthase n=1 Tax=Novipirellula aureliae TaxID=2527966 RepID=A0A5C6EBX0_9BACT|nr:polyprenyl synthetase family protein [Novipirellula aureliae]TWU45985.1 Farnesyl diphosphate synthase [Novipirellula aureliae]
MFKLNVIELPRAVPVQKQRKPKENIPQTLSERERMRVEVARFVAERNPVPPLDQSELRGLADDFMAQHAWPEIYADYAGVIINGEVWKDTLASVPFNRRLLLLPKCLRIEDKCPAPFDEFGLLCKQCGLCSIQDLQEEAERLGYAVLVAEGSALVMAIIETGKIEAIVGVSCLSVLEKAFPYVESAAIPGLAIPLLQDDCKDVTVDLEWIWEVIHLHSDDRTYRLDLDALRTDVQSWFNEPTITQMLGDPISQADTIARDWLSKDGKRWRPFLAACAWKAFQGESQTPPPEDLKRLAIAVECFHKASLIHDDIEDDDALRYGEATLHEQCGVPMALNIGDLLIGEGYRLIGECDLPPDRLRAVLRSAAQGHRMLSIGQGEELSWMRSPRPLSQLEVLDIFRRKTSPAFEVALQLGAILGGADDDVLDLLTRYSDSLGVAYQIRDDLEDFDSEHYLTDLQRIRPNLPLALLYERTIAKPEQRKLVERVWNRESSREELQAVRAMMDEFGILERCQVLQESFKEQSLRILAELTSPSLKGLLRRVVGKIFSLEVKGWCGESETRNGSSSETRATDPRQLDSPRG